MLAMKLPVFALCGLFLSLAGADDHSPGCYDDVSTCVDNLRLLMQMEESFFWFGNQYAQNCPPGSAFTRPSCSNPNPSARSIMARMYNISSSTDPSRVQSIKAVVDRVQLADVTYSAPKGSYYACGHRFDVPAITFKLDPTSIVTVNSWTFDQTPTIRWASPDPQALYTVLVWDVGVYYLHGLYVNALGGDLASAVAIDTYHGPMNGLLRPNIFVFAVFKQTGLVDIATVSRVLGGILAADTQRFHPAAFLQSMSPIISDLVAANIMSIVGDAYSMQGQKDNFISNNCPLLYAQLPVLRQVLEVAGVNGSWTPERMILNYKQLPQLSTLTVDLSVEYSMENDVEVDSCCVKTTYTKSLYRPDPLSSHVTRPVLTSSAPRVTISPMNIIFSIYTFGEGETYTLLMISLDNDVINSPRTSVIVHWMVTDIHHDDVSTGNHVLPYLGPIPQTADKPQPYLLVLLKQESPKMGPINLRDFAGANCPPVFDRRCNFDLNKMMTSLKLRDIRGVTWFQAEQDAYTRKRIYTEYDMQRGMFDVCDRQPGFEDPCPSQQFCGDSGANSAPGTRHGTHLYTASAVGVGLFLVALYSSLVV